MDEERAFAIKRPSENASLTVDQVYKQIGVGRYQYVLFIVCGLGYAADSIETGLLTFLSSTIDKEWPSVHGFELNLITVGVFVGEFLGCFIWGPLADRFGRRRAFLTSNICLLLFGGLSAAAQTYWQFVLVRFLVGVCIGGIVIPLDTLAESVDEAKSAQFAFAINYWWAFGTIYVNAAAAVVLDADTGDGWRLLVILCTVPIAIACVGYFVFEESALWLIDQGREQEALDVLRRVAKKNGHDISDVTLVAYEHEGGFSPTEIFSKSLLSRTIIFSVIWLMMAIGYYGASLAGPYIFNSGDGSTSYIEVFFGCSGEVAGAILGSVVLAVLSPMLSQSFFYSIATVACLLITMKDVISKTVLTMFDFALRMAMMGGSCVTFSASPLAFPTHIRATAHGFHYGVGRIGCILASSWPASTPLNVMLLTYAACNFVNVVVPVLGRHLSSVPEEEVFGVLRSELCATDESKRVRSAMNSMVRSSTLESVGRSRLNA